MIKYIEGEIYTINKLISDKEGFITDGLFLFEYCEGFQGVLKNYKKYKFKLYFNYSGETLKESYKHFSFQRALRFIVQDNLEIYFYWLGLKCNTSIISWVLGIYDLENSNGISIFPINYQLDSRLVWNFYDKDFSTEEFYGYKYRLANTEVVPTGLMTQLRRNTYLEKIDFINFGELKDDNLVSQIKYYHDGLFFIVHGFQSEAFLSFYKIIEIEERIEKKLQEDGKNMVNKIDLQEYLNDFLSKQGNQLNLESFVQYINNGFSKTSATNIRKQIHKKFNLNLDCKKFIKIGSIRGKFSHAHMEEEHYVFDGDCAFIMEITAEILGKKLENLLYL